MDEHAKTTLSKALVIGHLCLTMPCLLLALAVTVLVSDRLVAVGAATLVGVAWWSLLVPRWRSWALRSGLDPAELQRAAFRTGLVWPKGHFMERTEIYLSDKAFFGFFTALLLGVFLAAETLISEYLEQRLPLPGLAGPLLAAGLSAVLVYPVHRGLSRLVRRALESTATEPPSDVAGGTV